MQFLTPSRRRFLQSTTAAAAALIFPKSFQARIADDSFWFYHADTQSSWPTADAVQWSLENANQPVLERAAEGLSKLTANDCDRIIRLVVRRCRLNLVERRPGQVIVNHWGQQGLADLRLFFKGHGLARPEIEVVLLDRKKENATVKVGDDFLFGERIATGFPLDFFPSKFASRFTHEPDDRQAASGTSSGFAWEGVEDDCIPWAAFKCAWRRASPLICPNCDQRAVLANFGYPWTGMVSRPPKFAHVCGACRRSFRDDSVKDVAGWVVTNLDADVQPDFVMMWGKRVERIAT